MRVEREAALRRQLALLYDRRAEEVAVRMQRLLATWRERLPDRLVPPQRRLTQDDVVLITYADLFRAPDEAPLATLERVLRGPLAGTVGAVHLLPFYPSSSDDGFSVIDYRSVAPELGDWRLVTEIGRRHRLMFDAVVNHVSAESAYYRAFVEGRPPYRDFILTGDPTADLSRVVRPRTTPLLKRVDTAGGERHAWTTFSADQVDLDYSNPEVLLEIVDVLLGYVARGADMLRLDAVAFLWKEAGSSCLHHPKTHALLRVMRAALELAAPWVVLLTETNVPHRENVSYFGDGCDEAQMVYNFALPPLVLHALLTADGGVLQEWARDLRTPSRETTFFNFLASHDGIGLRPVEGILGSAELSGLVDAIVEAGGLVSSRSDAGGESPYELNISYFDAVNRPGARPLGLEVRRFLTAHALMLALAGVPGIYAHSLLGSRSAPEEVRRTGRARSINRRKLSLGRLQEELQDQSSPRTRVLRGFRRLLAVRRRHEAFHPQAPQRLLSTSRSVFGLLRGGERPVACLHNLSDEPCAVPRDALPAGTLLDLLAPGEPVGDEIALGPAGTRWLELG